MASSLPQPLRIALGLVATGVDRVRALPEDLPALPVTVAGAALRISLRVHQQLAELAARGDEVMAGWSNDLPDRPAWARFDDEDGTSLAPDEAPDRAPAETAEPTTDPASAVKADASADDDWARAADPPEASEPSKASDPSDPQGPGTDAPTAPDDSEVGKRPAGLPPAVADYPSLSVSQLQSRLPELSHRELSDLLHYEEQHGNRPPFLTVLGNRLATAADSRPGSARR